MKGGRIQRLVSFITYSFSFGRFDDLIEKIFVILAFFVAIFLRMTVTVQDLL
jgi:hypothetical protein